MENSLQYFRALEQLDAIHKEDPRLEGGVPQELLYAQHMTAKLCELDPYASEALLLAARAQHIRRWSIARESFPEGPVGYKQWRRALTNMHVEVAGNTLETVGYDLSTIVRTQALIRKENFKHDEESQLLEDIVCLVFLEHEFPAFAAKYPEAKVLDIVRKTWNKMSSKGQQEALKLSFGTTAKDLVMRAVA